MRRAEILPAPSKTNASGDYLIIPEKVGKIKRCSVVNCCYQVSQAVQLVLDLSLFVDSSFFDNINDPQDAVQKICIWCVP